jgi:tRNA(fMet)-specific endonuclease VapC
LRRNSTDRARAELYERIAATASQIAQFQIVAFSENAMRLFRELKLMKLNVGANDLRIAAIAREYSATVITRNIRDFSRIPDLHCDDWTN